MSTFILLNSSKMSSTHDCELHAMNGKDNAIKTAIVGHIFILTINVMAFSSQCMNSKKNTKQQIMCLYIFLLIMTQKQYITNNFKTTAK